MALSKLQTKVYVDSVKALMHEVAAKAQLVHWQHSNSISAQSVVLSTLPSQCKSITPCPTQNASHSSQRPSGNCMFQLKSIISTTGIYIEIYITQVYTYRKKVSDLL